MKKANCLILLILVLITSCRKEEDLMEERYVGEINLNQEYGVLEETSLVVRKIDIKELVILVNKISINIFISVVTYTKK